jgi:hypothetical protein
MVLVPIERKVWRSGLLRTCDKTLIDSTTTLAPTHVVHVITRQLDVYYCGGYPKMGSRCEWIQG